MSVSSTTLFHFTDEYETLLAILKDEGFWAKYCKEKRWDCEEVIIPMVCFCDIPLTQIKNHTQFYGKYALGLFKSEWSAVGRNVLPVFYVKKDYMNRFLKFSESMLTNVTKQQKHDFTYRINCRIKAFDGYAYCKESGKTERKIFYDAKEWRYVFHTSQDKQLLYKLDSEEWDTLNEKTYKKKLKFQLQDIAYIIIEKEEEREQLINDILREKNKYPKNIQNVLISRIISIEQINKDF